MYDKSERLAKLAEMVKFAINVKVDDTNLKRTALLSKTDLVAGMVVEFTELQGVMGREYAKLDGEPAEVAEGIYEHYLPRFAGDELPKGTIGRIVGISDKIDNIVATFSRGLAPTGSQDPYALRRQALGIINILISSNYHMPLIKILAGALYLLNIKPEDTGKLIPQILEFFKLRLKNMMIEQGIRYDVVDAVFADERNDDLVDIYARCKALNAYVVLPEAEAVIQASIRVCNLCKKIETEVAISSALFADPAEQELHDVLIRLNKELIPDIMKAYHALEEQYDIIVIEGAGSPAEINLKADDIVNMGMAKLVDAPVLLVGDIDRGGVFAQLYGTVELLEPDERDRIKGLIINKFRGDKTILDPGVVMLEEKTHIPVVGVAPYLHIEVEDEDSLTERFTRKEEIGLIDLAVIRLPRISNFTDFNPFERIEGVSLRYVSSVSELKNPDMILLPGTKNTMEDLLWMRQNGLEAAVLKAAAAGKVIFGVCGGFQMLGDTLSDPLHVEAGGTIKGMGLLPMDTVFAGEKTRTRAEGAFGKTEGVLAGIEGTRIEGYEIHMGETVRKEETEAFTFIDDQNRADSDKLDGAQKGNVYGTYVHGIFDKEEVAERIVEALAKNKGIAMEQIHGVDYQTFKETQYDILADALREHLDMKKIYQILEEGA